MQPMWLRWRAHGPGRTINHMNQVAVTRQIPDLHPLSGYADARERNAVRSLNTDQAIAP